MARVQRGNVVLTVKEEEVQHYLQLGYNLTTPTGQVIKSAIPTDFATLQKFYIEGTARIEELENTIAKLSSELSELRRTKKQAEPAPAKTPAKKSTKA